MRLQAAINYIILTAIDPVKSIRKFLIECFNENHKTNLNPESLSEDEELAVQRWVNRDTDLHFISVRNDCVSTRTLFFNESDKASYIQQSKISCQICGREPIRFFPIRISPKSHQTISPKLKQYYQREIRNHPFVNKDSDYFDVDGLCVQLVLVLRESRDKDADNMAKLVLDSLEGKLYRNDNQIDHLQVIKFKSSYLEEHIKVGIAKSNLNNHQNTLFNTLNSSWAGQERIDLSS